MKQVPTWDIFDTHEQYVSHPTKDRFSLLTVIVHIFERHYYGKYVMSAD